MAPPPSRHKFCVTVVTPHVSARWCIGARTPPRGATAAKDRFTNILFQPFRSGGGHLGPACPLPAERY